MAPFLPRTAPLAGGSHRQDNIWRVSQPAAMEDHVEPTLLLPWLTETLLLFRFSLENVPSLLKIFGVRLKTWIYLLPKLPAFLIKAPFLSVDTCLSSYWILSGEQPNLSSITSPLEPEVQVNFMNQGTKQHMCFRGHTEVFWQPYHKCGTESDHGETSETSRSEDVL